MGNQLVVISLCKLTGLALVPSRGLGLTLVPSLDVSMHFLSPNQINKRCGRGILARLINAGKRENLLSGDKSF